MRSEFGHKVVPPQPLLKVLPTMFDAKQPAVRDAVKKLMVPSNPYTRDDSSVAIHCRQMYTSCPCTMLHASCCIGKTAPVTT